MRSKVIAGILMICAGVLTTSCVKDEIITSAIENDLELRFTTSQAYRDQFKEESGATRSGTAEVNETTTSAVTEVSGDESLGRPLYLHMSGKKMSDPTQDEVDAAFGKTRSAITTSGNIISVHGTRGLGIFAYVYRPNTWDPQKTTSAYVHNLPAVYYTTASKIKDDVVLESKDCNYWALNNPVTSYSQYHWPGANYDIRIYAYAPYAGKNSNNEGNIYADDIITIPDALYKGAPVIDYMVYGENKYESTKNLPLHPDFIVAGTGNLKGNTNATQPLSFKHALSCVSFVVGKDIPAGKVTKIEFQNIYKGGSINLEYATDNDVSTKAWTVKTETKGSVSLEKEITIKAEGEELIEDADNFMMLPQTLPDDALLVIYFTDENNESTVVTGEIGGYQWDMGYHYVYTLDTQDSVRWEFEVDTDMVKNDDGVYKLSDDYLGGAQTSWTIKSYKVISNPFHKTPSQEAVGWKAQAYIDNKWVDITTKPDIFSKFTNSGTGSVTEQTFNAEMATIVPDDPWNPFGQPAERDAELAGVVDLYNDVSGGSTANCYVINQAGTYSFPLFYGNAMKGHQANTSAYSGNAFVDYNGASIVNPNISIPSTACAKLLWCDAPQLVTDVELSANTVNYDGYSVRTIKFRVPRENITPGNAVIALYDKDGGTIMWSWHIWVTTWNPNITPNTEVPEVKNSDGSIRIAKRKHSVAVESYNNTFYFATEILGYCPSRKATWNERDIKIRFVQVDNGVEIEGKVSAEYYFHQTSNSINQQYGEGNMPYYQWGRKDPLLPYHYLTDANGVSITGEEKFCYSANFTQFTFGIVKIFGTLKTNNVLTGKSIKESIQNPHVFYSRYRNSPATANDGSEYDWCNDDFPAQYSRWDSGNTSYTSVDDIKTQKTIYDPCPVGWCVPPAGAWRGILADGGATGGCYITETATYYPNDKTKSFSISGLVTPITGDRNRYLGTPWVDTKNARPCEFWTSGINIGTGADGIEYSGCGYMVISYSSSYTIGLLGMSSGFAVLPVKEH